MKIEPEVLSRMEIGVLTTLSKSVKLEMNKDF